jgi:hypothetical protein
MADQPPHQTGAVGRRFETPGSPVRPRQVGWGVRPQTDTRSQDCTPGDELLPVAGRVPRVRGPEPGVGHFRGKLPL